MFKTDLMESILKIKNQTYDMNFIDSPNFRKIKISNWKRQMQVLKIHFKKKRKQKIQFLEDEYDVERRTLC